MNNLPKIEELIDPEQPAFIYDIHKSWEEVVQNAPNWKSGKFPPLPTEKNYERSSTACKFLGVDLISPIAISAGPASRRPWTGFYLKMGYGMVLEKTRRSTPRKSNQAPNVSVVKSDQMLSRENLSNTLTGSMDESEWEKYQSMTNSFGNPSPTIQVWANELKEQVKDVSEGQILACSVTATFPEGGPVSSDPIAETVMDLLVAASAAVTAGAKVIEFNLACPNVTENTEEGEMFMSPELVKYLFAEFKRRFPDVKAGFKFGLYKNKEQMRKVLNAASGNLDYLSGINAVAVNVLAEDGSQILPGRSKSGVCGKILKDLALEAIRWADEIRKEDNLKFEILGGGGITKVEDVDEFLAAGADMVQVASIAMADPLFAYKYRLFKQQ